MNGATKSQGLVTNGATSSQHQLVKLSEGKSIFDTGSTIQIGADNMKKQIKRCCV
jgi:hypothetical protein